MVWDYMNLNSQNQLQFLFFTLLGHITSVNNVVVTVLYLLWALHRRIIGYGILYKIQRIRASLSGFKSRRPGTSINLSTGQ